RRRSLRCRRSTASRPRALIRRSSGRREPHPGSIARRSGAWRRGSRLPSRESFLQNPEARSRVRRSVWSSQVFFLNKSKFTPPDADRVSGFDRSGGFDALSVQPDAVAAPLVDNQKFVAFADYFGVVTTDAVAVEHDVVFLVSPDPRQATSQLVSNTRIGGDQRKPRVGRVLVIEIRVISNRDRFVNFRFINFMTGHFMTGHFITGHFMIRHFMIRHFMIGRFMIGKPDTRC